MTRSHLRIYVDRIYEGRFVTSARSIRLNNNRTARNRVVLTLTGSDHEYFIAHTQVVVVQVTLTVVRNTDHIRVGTNGTCDLPFYLRELVSTVVLLVQRSYYVVPVLLNDPARILNAELDVIDAARSAGTIVKYQTHGVPVRLDVVVLTHRQGIASLRNRDRSNLIFAEQLFVDDVLESNALCLCIEVDAVSGRFSTGVRERNIELFVIRAEVGCRRILNEGRTQYGQLQRVDSREKGLLTINSIGEISALSVRFASPRVLLSLADGIYGGVPLSRNDGQTEGIRTITAVDRRQYVVVFAGLIVFNTIFPQILLVIRYRYIRIFVVSRVDGQVDAYDTVAAFSGLFGEGVASGTSQSLTGEDVRQLVLTNRHIDCRHIVRLSLINLHAV